MANWNWNYLLAKLLVTGITRDFNRSIFSFNVHGGKFLISLVCFIFIKHLQWKHKEHVVDTPDIKLSPILQHRLEEEDGPAAVDDLEAHAGGRGNVCHQPTLPASDQRHLTGSAQRGA